MGAEAWSYFVPYQPNLQSALEQLRRREFATGRYRGSELRPATIEEALENMDADGTASILDMMQLSATPAYFSVAPLTPAQMATYFGTDRPTRTQVEMNFDEIYEEIARGQGVYILVYEHNKPSEIFFGGYSFD